MAQASRYETWPVRGRLRGKNGKKSKDVSGIDCATAQGFPRAGLVIDDNMQEAQFVSLKDGEIVAGDMIALDCAICLVAFLLKRGFGVRKKMAKSLSSRRVTSSDSQKSQRWRSYSRARPKIPDP